MELESVNFERRLEEILRAITQIRGRILNPPSQPKSNANAWRGAPRLEIRATSPTTQYGTPGIAVKQPPEVTATAGGKPIAGIWVRFQVVQGEGLLSERGGPTRGPVIAIQTEKEGIAVCGEWVLGNQGRNRVVVVATGLEQTPVDFIADAGAAPPVAKAAGKQA